MLQHDIKHIDELTQQYGIAVVEQANLRALNFAIAKLRTFVSKNIRAKYNVTAAAIARRVTMRKASSNHFQAHLRYVGPRVSMINFGAKPKNVTIARKSKTGRRWGRKRTGVTVKILKKGSRKQITSVPAFIATGKSGNRHVFMRNSSKRDDITAMSWRSVPQMVLSAERGGSAMDYDAFAVTEHAREFDRVLTHLLSKSK